MLNVHRPQSESAEPSSRFSALIQQFAHRAHDVSPLLSTDRPPNVLRFSCRRGARRKITSKKPRSRAPTAVNCKRLLDAPARGRSVRIGAKGNSRWMYLCGLEAEGMP